MTTRILILLLFTFFLYSATQNLNPNTMVVLLGTGTPFAQPDKSGPSFALITNNETYLIDCGPGIVRRSAQAFANGVEELEPKRLNKVFITHLHSDHTAGLPDLFLTPAVLGRPGALMVFGPKGTQKMVENIIEAYAEDISVRTRGPELADPNSYKMETKENKEGLVYQDDFVKVTGFKVNHGSWSQAYGYRFDTANGKRIVFSGDCTYTPEIINQCNGCDILIHEVYSMEALSKRPEQWQNYHSQFHTSSKQLAELATLARPKLLVLVHQLSWGMGDEQVLKEVESYYKGPVISGKDLDVFGISETPQLLTRNSYYNK